jgi:transcription antitermination factor NusG
MLALRASNLPTSNLPTLIVTFPAEALGAFTKSRMFGGGYMGRLWYALSTRSRFENVVDVHLQARGLETFLPTYIEKRKWSDRIKSVSLPLFPGYIFCRFDINERLPVLMIPGVNFVVGVGRSPLPVDESEVASLQQAVGSGQPLEPCSYLNVGQTVVIDRGRLQGLRGIVIRIKNVDRLVVSVSLLMRSVAVELDRDTVKPVGSVVASCEVLTKTA